MTTFSSSRVLITGATGFLGGKLVHLLLDQGATVRVIARTPEKAAALAERGAQVMQADLTDANSLRQAAQGCDLVFHVAVDYTSYAKQVAVNVDGTRNLALASVDAGVKRFVHVSTAAAYGSLIRGDVYEDQPLYPAAYPYSITKAQGERELLNIAARTGLPYTIVRPGMIYGEHSPTWTDLLFSIAQRTPTFWLNDGSGSAHLIHIDDVVNLLVICATHPAAVNQIFHCTPDPAPSWREVFTHYAALADQQPKIVSLKPIASIAAGIAMLVSPPISMGRELPDLLELISTQVTFKMTNARDLLGWSPHIALADGIASCRDYLRTKGLLRDSS